MQTDDRPVSGKPYRPPTLSVYGRLQDLTLGAKKARTDGVGGTHSKSK